MGNRGQKRADSDEELPADKRACSSLDFRPSSSGSSAQTPTSSLNLAPEAREGDLDTSSSSSESSRSDGGERDSAYGSCDSDEMDVEQRQRRDTYRDYQERRSSANHAKLQGVLGSLSEEVEQSTQIAALTELCEVLSFSVDSSLSNPMVDSLSQNLVKLARHESNPDIMLLAIRAITYLCDVHSRSSSYLVRHNAVPALCQRLMIIEYLDVAEQCLQALEKISREQPLHCLQAGAIMAVLGYIDFFSTSVQRVALKTVVNICKKLPSKYPPSLMEAIPVLCNLLQYEDGQLVENVATCLIKIAERVCDSPGMLDELCKHGLIHRATHLIDLNSRITLCPPVHSGLIGLLVKLASGSIIAFRTLFELNISNILKNILSTYDLSHGGMPSHFMVDGNCNQVHEVLKLLDELLPAIARDQDMQLNMDKESFLVKQPHLLQKFALDLLPVLTQVVNSGVSLYVCYGCLSVIYKLVYFSSSDMLLELLKCTNISSFLAGVFTRKDHHVLILALQTVDNILQKLSDVFLSSFIKEGVLFAVDALVTPEKCSHFVFQMFNGMQLTSDQSQSPKSALRDVPRCLCYAFVSNKQSPSNSESGSCKFEKDYVHKLATRIRSDYFAAQLLNSEEGTTDILQKLKMMSATLTNMVNSSTHNEEEFYHILHQIMAQLNGSNPISTFEFLESGIIRSLLSYLSNGSQCFNQASSQQVYTVEKRFEVLGRLLLSSSDPMGNLYLSALVQKLQSALSSVENFPIVLGQVSKRINSYAIIPHGCNTAYPCLKVQFVKGEGEEFLGDYSGEVFTVDPFSQLDAIDGYLWPRVTGAAPAHSPARSMAGSGSPECRSPDLVKSEGMSSDHEIEKEKPDLQDESGEVASSGKTTGESTDMNEEVLTDSGEQQHTSSSDEDNNSMTESSESPRKGEAASPNLSFYLDGQQLDHSLTLYQAILQQQTKAEHAVTSATTIWSQAYKLTYRRAVKHNYVLEKIGNYRLYTPFFSDVFLSDLTSDVEKSSPAYDILFLLKSLEGMNRFRYHLMSRERACSFAEGRIDNLDILKVAISDLQNEFVNTRLTEKLEQQMRDPLFVSVGGMPSWCSQLMASCPFLFSFEARCTYFRLAALGQRQVQPHISSQNNVGGLNGGRQRNNSNLPRKKFLVDRNFILESATQMMDLHAHQKFVLEVEYEEEVGTGLGPTLEFYTLVSHEFQKFGLGMWREDHMSFTKDSATLMSPFGLFPRPWSSAVNISNGIEFTEVVKKYVLLGQVVAKALKDGRVLDIPFSKSFYKLVLGQDLTVYDIPSFDSGLGTTLLEFQAIVERKQYLLSVAGDKSTCQIESCFRNTRIEDLYLDFTLPGYPDFVFAPGTDSKMVDMINLEEYVSLIVDATISSGISRQVEAFKLGFNQVFPIRHLQILSEEELERLLCGECELWNLNELLDHVKFDHGYTASSPPVMNLLAIIREFDREQQKAFLRFVTGAPRLPRGGLASLNPKLTIVRKHCGKCADADLPSVMTCANYLKLPPYSTKETMKEKLLYAIIEGQGSFHLS